MEQLKMHAIDYAKENVQKVAQLFPNCVTETANGLAIDFEKLQQELSEEVMSGSEERYQFTWPGKRAAIREANSPCYLTLRPSREDSVDFDKTKNLYIEGDNLQVLKLLRESYLGKVKMIYIDPPYNTGNDFVYNDDFSQSAADYKSQSDMFDEEGNMLLQNYEVNSEASGRFHSGWLNMMYPRLKVAKDLLREDGIVFIHIDEHEVYNLQVVCREIFGQSNELGTIIWDKRNPKGEVVGVAYQHESILVFCKNKTCFNDVIFAKNKENAVEMMQKVADLVKKHGGVTAEVRSEYKKWLKSKEDILSGGEKAYSLIDKDGRIYQAVSMAAPDKPETRSHRPLIHPITQKVCPVPEMGWRFKDSALDEMLGNDRIEFGVDESTQPRQRYYLEENLKEAVSSLLYYGGSDDADGLPFDNPKPLYVAQRIISTIGLSTDKDDIILDFFSGSATSASAVMHQNMDDGGKRRFIMVQLPELTKEKSEAYKAGYKNICEIGKERIRRAGKKIKEEAGEAAKDLDTGFRVLKLASSNMNDVYYTPQDTNLNELFAENIKSDRTPEDLLFQVLPELNLPLSAKIETKTIAGKQVFVVEDNYLAACFDEDITDECITAIAKTQPYHFVIRESGAHTDQVLDNFDQLFKAYSPKTTTHVM